MNLNQSVLDALRSMKPTYTRKRVGYLGRYDSSGNIDPDVHAELTPDYSWVRFSEDRSATRVKNLKVRAEWGTAVWVEYNELTREDEVREVHSILAPVQFGGAIAAALNVPGIPATVSTPVSANDVMPGRVVMVTDTALTVRIWATWTPHGTYWDGSTLITITPTATSSKRSFACVGITSAGASVVTLTTDRAVTYPFTDSEGALSSSGAGDIQTVMDAASSTWWVGAILISNGDTAIDPTRIYDLRFWRTPTMKGANGSVAGERGIVPAPSASDNVNFLRGDGTWAATASGGSLAGSIWFPRAVPASPSAEDDEFADASGGVPSGWTEVDHGTVTTVDEDVDGLRLTQSTHASNSVSGIYKAIPAGDFTIWTELAIYASVTGASQAAIAGLALYQDATSSTGDMALLYIGYAASNVPEFAVATFTAYNSAATGLASAFGNRITVPPRGFLRIRRTGTTYSYDISHDGLGAYRLYTGTLAFTPTHYGIAVSNLNSGADIRGVASFFRYTASDVGVISPFEGQRVNYYV